MQTQLCSPQPVRNVAQLEVYRSESPQRPITLKLDANEGPMFELDPATFNESCSRAYPDKSELEKRLATKFNVRPEQVVVTAGGDEAIDRISRAYLEPGRNLVFPEPSFEMIRKYATIAGAEVRSVIWQAEFPVDQILASADETTSIVSVVSPNNPTGKTVDVDSLRRLATELPSALILVDQAYAEFEDASISESLTQVALSELPNAVVVRTFSKAWGLAGLRVGYALGNSTIIENLKRVGGPYPVSSISLAAGNRCLANPSIGRAIYIERVFSEREQLQSLLQSNASCEVTSSQGNFVYVRFGSTNVSAQFVYDALAAQGILVRRFPDQNALRITCPGNEQDFERLTSTLNRILNPKAILFDMDGVLVDESRSYREAIRLTCLDFGIDVSIKEIFKLKMLGNANNDWEFTFKLLSDRGLDISFEQVKTRFEQIYQGDANSPGLWNREVRLVERNWLENLATKYPLAIVTGRPRNDAERFLQTECIRDLFTVVVCMEDGPAKPAPDNVCLALQKLDVDSAWMIGDSPDDIGAAVSAGLVGIGIVAPEDDPKAATEKLVCAGAATVVESLDEFGELLR